MRPTRPANGRPAATSLTDAVDPTNAGQIEEENGGPKPRRSGVDGRTDQVGVRVAA